MQLSQPISLQTEFTISNFFKRLDKEGRLYAVHCKECNTKMIPPRPVCSRCLSSNLAWIVVPDQGRIVAFSEIHSSNDSFQKLVPYIVCIAEFGGGLNIPGIVKNARNNELKVGSFVKTKTQTKAGATASAESSSQVEGPAYWFEISEDEG
jgi:uncharacterized protein